MSDIFATNFTAADWIIVSVYLIGTVVVGAVVNRYVHSVSDFMVGGRASGTALNTATYIGTGLGLVTLMYASMEGFNNGFAYMALAVIAAIVSVFIGSTGFVIARLRELELTTIPEYFERRFSRATRVTAGIICALAGILNMGLFPKMGATFITYATGIAEHGESTEMLVNLITSLLIVFVLVYTVLGGMVSVIVTDYIQFVVLAIGMGIGLVIFLTHPQIGWQQTMDTWSSAKGEAAFNPFHKDSYGGVWVVWQVCVFLTAMIAWAPEATRALTARDVRTAKRTFLWATPNAFVRLAIPAFWGIAAVTFFAAEPTLSEYFFPDGVDGSATHAMHAMPLLIGKIIPTGLIGVLVAGLLAAFMSTHDSYFLCWSSVIVRDVVNPLRGADLSERGQIVLTRFVIVGIGAFLLVWGVWYDTPDSVWNYMAVTGTIYLSGAGVTLIGGVYWTRASSTGAIAALVGGLVAISSLFIDKIRALCETYVDGIAQYVTTANFALGNFVFCAIVFVVFSLLFPDPSKTACELRDAPITTP
jgi:SSS family solute:Na+ symporter